MDTLLTILAVAGIGAAAWHVMRAAFRFLRQKASGLWTDELARTHARRGDVTALKEMERRGAEVARARRRATVEAAGWVALLVVPALTPWSRAIYAAYAVLWAIPVLRRRSP
ncbi:MAG TPA: hypothetical protein VMM12_01315 [Longimicrobiales bacterium]|nr:hypothetical protein [Longimicrobiales bacterium]